MGFDLGHCLNNLQTVTADDVCRHLRPENNFTLAHAGDLNQMVGIPGSSSINAYARGVEASRSR